MKVLWHVNLFPPEVEKELGLGGTIGGGWLIGLRDALLARHPDIQLTLCCCYYGIDAPVSATLNHVVYHAVPYTSVREDFARVLQEVEPDIVHLHGTESQNAQIMASLARPQQLVASIQGLMSECAKHYYDGVPEHYKEVPESKRKLSQKFTSGFMKDQYQYFVNSIPAEEETLRTVRYVIGRTRWDKSCALAINPNLKYFHCNEIIRAPFYSGKWSLDACEKHSVYISQAHYPIKGAHMLYQALGKVRRKYPDVKLYIGGWPQTHEKNPLREIMMNYMSEYRGYLHTLARKNHLLGHIFYIGPLDENQVKTQLLRTHVYVSSSSIENESNSLSEAKLLGVPCVSSCVGGVADRLVDGKDGYFYDFYDIDALANHICTLFENRALDEAFSKEARKNAAMVNDIANNADTMAEIYHSIQTDLTAKL